MRRMMPECNDCVSLRVELLFKHVGDCLKTGMVVMCHGESCRDFMPIKNGGLKVMEKNKMRTMETKPTYDDLISALYMIWELAVEGGEKGNSTLKIIEIRELCKHILSE
jgi:hypothetical protein